MRNREALVEAALPVFMSVGVDAPAKQIADRAGVGVGTLYRHFPRRADLIKAVFQARLDATADASALLLADHPPDVALEMWIDRFMEFVATKHGLIEALESNEPAYLGLPAYFMERLGTALGALLDAGVAAGSIRAEVRAEELMYAIARLSRPIEGADPDAGRRLIAVLINGLRAGPAR